MCYPNGVGLLPLVGEAQGKAEEAENTSAARTFNVSSLKTTNHPSPQA